PDLAGAGGGPWGGARTEREPGARGARRERDADVLARRAAWLLRLSGAALGLASPASRAHRPSRHRARLGARVRALVRSGCSCAQRRAGVEGAAGGGGRASRRALRCGPVVLAARAGLPLPAA